METKNQFVGICEIPWGKSPFGLSLILEHYKKKQLINMIDVQPVHLQAVQYRLNQNPCKCVSKD